MDLNNLAQFLVDKSVDLERNNKDNYEELVLLRRFTKVCFDSMTRTERSKVKNKLETTQRNIRKKILVIKSKNRYGNKLIDDLEVQLNELKKGSGDINYNKKSIEVIYPKPRNNSFNNLFNFDNLTDRSIGFLINFAEWLNKHKIILELLLDEHLLRLLKMYLRERSDIRLTNLQRINLQKMKNISELYTQRNKK